MSEPWGDNSRPDEGCGFCSDFQRMKDEPEVCWSCPHDPGGLTIDQVKAAGLPATIQAVGKHGGAYTIDYLPGNRNKERFRVTGGAPYHNTTFGPGGEHTPADGWHHAGGCECELCRDGA